MVTVGWMLISADVHCIVFAQRNVRIGPTLRAAHVHRILFLRGDGGGHGPDPLRDGAGPTKSGNEDYISMRSKI